MSPLVQGARWNCAWGYQVGRTVEDMGGARVVGVPSLYHRDRVQVRKQDILDKSVRYARESAVQMTSSGCVFCLQY